MEFYNLRRARTLPFLPWMEEGRDGWMERTTTQRYYRSRWYLEGFWFLLEDFFKDYIFAW
jgi:hypothetical protein